MVENTKKALLITRGAFLFILVFLYFYLNVFY